MRQTPVNHLFNPYIGVWMDVYIDDIAIYSDTLGDRVQHVRADILKQKKLTSASRSYSSCERNIKMVGHIVDDSEIRMDPAKVANALTWKVLTNRGLLRGSR